MSGVLNFILVFLSIFGIFIFIFHVLCSKLLPAVVHVLPSRATNSYPKLFLFAVSWPLSFGLRGLISAWGYYSGVSIQQMIYVLGALGVIGLFMSRPIGAELKNIVKYALRKRSFSAPEIVLILMILMLMAMYFYRAGLPWGDTDEMTQYGVYAKLIASDWSYLTEAELRGGASNSGSRLAHTLDAQLISLIQDTQLARVFRGMNLIFSSLSLYFFLSLFGIKRIYKLIGALYLLANAELCQYGTSFKVDSVVMMLEFHAFLLLALAILNYMNERKNKGYISFSFPLSFTAVVLASFALGNRTSGIYVLLLSLIVALFLFFRNLKYKLSIMQCYLLIGLCILVFFSSIGYIVNFQIYGNPTYPWKSDLLFPHGEFTSSYEEYYFSLSRVQGLPPFFLQIYLLFYMGFGFPLIDRYFSLPPFIPMAPHKMSFVWAPNPILLLFFFWPFFVKQKKILSILGGIFIYQLICWSSGPHMGRTFLGASLLVLLIAVFTADLKLEPHAPFLKKVQTVVRSGLWLALIPPLIIQIYWFKKFYSGPEIFYNAHKRFEFNIEFLRGSKGGRYVQDLPSYEDFKQINALIAHVSKPIIVNFSPSDVLHIFFNEGFFTNHAEIGYAQKGLGDLAFVNIEYAGINNLSENIKREFPIEMYRTQNQKWVLLAKDR